MTYRMRVMLDYQNMARHALRYREQSHQRGAELEAAEDVLNHIAYTLLGPGKWTEEQMRARIRDFHTRATAAEAQLAELREQGAAAESRAEILRSEVEHLRALNRESNRQALEEIGRLRGALEKALAFAGRTVAWYTDFHTTDECAGYCHEEHDPDDEESEPLCQHQEEAQELKREYEEFRAALASRVTVEVETEPGTVKTCGEPYPMDDADRIHGAQPPTCVRQRGHDGACALVLLDAPQPTDTADGEGEP